VAGVLERNCVRVSGVADGRPLVFVHGFGCDQAMWRFVVPDFEVDHRVVMLDLVGSGNSDLSAYDPQKYASLKGYAADIVEICRELQLSDVVFVGHSVSAMIGLLASVKQPDAFAAQIMIGPSPCYINDGDYVGGFSRTDIDSLLVAIESNYLGWSSNMAPAIMGAPEQPELAAELTNSFCRTDPEIALQFARVTFLSDVRADVPKLRVPALIVQCNDDLIAPISVGEYLHRELPRSMLRVIENLGHCPHLSAPSSTAQAMDAFLDEERL
jgi:sigma-B regulation protein RsbQ